MEQRALGSAALLASLLLGCGANTSPDPMERDGAADVTAARCIPGASVACVCARGMGAQTCLPDGTFSPCFCTPTPPCVRGMSVACACTDGRMGAQVCVGEEGYGPCECSADDAGGFDASRDVVEPDAAVEDVLRTPDACVRTVCASIAAGCGRYNDGCGGVLDCGLCRAPVVREARVPANDIVVDRARNLVYASVSSTVPMYGNRVVLIDATTASVTGSIFVGSEPGSMAMSDDGTKLFVSLVGANAIREVDLSTRTAGAQFPIGVVSFGEMAHARDMVVMPGTRDVLVTSLHRVGVSPSFAGVAVFSGGVRRPTMTPGHTGASLLVAGDATRVYGFNNLSTGFGFYELTVSDDGVRQTRAVSSLISGFDTTLVASDGLVYASSGQVVDTVTLTSAGRYAGGGLAVPDRPRGRVYFVRSAPFGGSVSALDVYDHDMFTLLDSVPLTTIAGTARQALRYSPGGIVVRVTSGTSGTGTIYFLQSGLIATDRP